MTDQNEELKEFEEKHLIDLGKYKPIPNESFLNFKSNFSAIYHIQNIDTKKEYVLKTCIHKEYEIYFKREIRILTSLKYRVFIDFHGFSYHGFNPNEGISIIMKYMEGGSLSKLLENSQKGLLTKTYTITNQQIMLIGIAFGMKILHQNKIIHRDLKPDNILLDSDYLPYITDFGLSKYFDPYNSNSQSIICGTPKYIAPEAIVSPEYDIKVDVWAFGLIMYEIIYGHYAYPSIEKGLTKRQFEDYILECHKPTFDYEINENIKKLILKCLLKEPSERPSFSFIFRKLCSLSPNYMHKYRNIFYDSDEIKEEEENDEEEEYSSNPCNHQYFLDGVDAEDVFEYIQELIDDVIGADEDLQSWQKIKKNCVDIFSIQLKSTKINDDFVKSLIKYFPKDAQRQTILNNLKKGSFKFFSFPINSSNLRKILDNKHLFEDQSAFEIITLYVFHTWISTCLLIFNGRKKMDFSILLTALNYIMKTSSTDLQKKKYYDISLSCFVDITNISIENKIIDHCANFLKELSSFFTIIKSAANPANQMLIYLSKEFINQDDEMSEKATKFIDLLINILITNPNVLLKETLQLIIESTKSFLLNFNTSCLKLLSYSINYIQYDYFISIYHQLLDKILFQNDLFLITNIDEKEESFQHQVPIPNDINSSNLTFDLYQLDKIDDSLLTTFLKVKDLSSFFYDEMLHKLLIFRKIVIQKIEYSLSFLLKTEDALQLLQNSSSINEDIYYKKCHIIFFMISLIVKKYKDIQISNELKEYLFQTQLFFDPDNTYFTKRHNFELINSLRHFVFKFLLNYDTKLLNQILLSNFVYPNLFGENVCRIMTIKNEEDCDIVNSKFCELVDTLTISLVVYRVKESDSGENITKLFIRKTILLLINSVLKDNNVLSIVFHSSNFLKCFFQLLIEPPIEKVFIGFLFNYLKNVQIKSIKDIDEHNDLYQNMINIISASMINLSPNIMFPLFTDIFNFLFESIKFNSSLSNLFAPILSDVYKSIQNLNINSDEIEGADTFVLSLINFLAGTLHNKPIEPKNMLVLEALITPLVKPNTQKEIISILIQLSADKFEDNLEPSFQIQNSVVIYSLIRIFLKTDCIYEIIDFISKLCSYSQDNCIKCHEAKLDLLIIEILNEWKKIIIEEKNKLVITDELINSFLYLFLQISSIISSFSGVKNFFSLISPIDFQYFSPIHINILKTLCNEKIHFNKNAFLQIFSNNYKEYLIVPLFYYLIIPIKCDYQCQFLINRSIDFLSILLSYVEHSQVSFYEYKYFLVIAGLLENAKNLTINFNLYMSFYNLLNLIIDDKLKIQLIDSILMNISLWSRCQPEEQLKIFENWAQKISIAHQIKTPSFLFMVYHDFNFKNNELQNECQKPLFNIILNSLTDKVFPDQLEEMSGLFCSSITSTNEKKQILNIFLEIFKEQENVSKYQSEIDKFLISLLAILECSNKDDEIVSKIIYLFIAIRKEISCLTKIIQNIIYSLKGYILDKESFSGLIRTIKSQKAFDFIPIIYYITILGGTEYLNIFLNYDIQNFKCDDLQFVSIYSVFLLFAFTSTESYQDVIQMNISMFKDNLKVFIFILYNVSYFYFSPSIYNQILHDFFIEILNNQTLEIDDKIIFHILMFVIMRTKNENATILQHEFKLNNYLFNECKVEITSDCREKNDLKSKIIGIISTMNSFQENSDQPNEDKLVFFLRFNDLGEWLDLDLAKLLFQFFQDKSLDIKIYQYVLYHFIKKSDSKFEEKIKNDNIFLQNSFDEIFLKEDHFNEIIMPIKNIYMHFLEYNVFATFKNEILSTDILYDFIQKHKNCNHKYDELKLQKYMQYSRVMDNLKYSMLFNQIPWEEIHSNIKAKTKRTNSFSFVYCPYQIKQIIQFNRCNNKLSNNEIADNITSALCKQITIKAEKNIKIQFIENSIQLSNCDNFHSTIIRDDKIDSFFYSVQFNGNSSLEILTTARKSYFILFDGILTDSFLTKIQKNTFIDLTQIHFKGNDSFNKLVQIIDNWVAGEISNFEYLMSLNIYSGRSFNNISQYPVFPWIICDYSSPTLDLNDERIFRDLSLPIGALNKENKSSIYRSCYSNPHSVCYYLSRIEPFTSKFIEDNKEKSEIFSSINDSFNQVKTSSSDLRELIPEFFYFPEFLMQNSSDFKDVVLPPWANNSPFEFIYMRLFTRII